MAPPHQCQKWLNWEIRLSSRWRLTIPPPKVVSVETIRPGIPRILLGKEISNHFSFPQWRGIRADTVESHDFHPAIIISTPPLPDLCQWKPYVSLYGGTPTLSPRRYQWRPSGDPELLLTLSSDKNTVHLGCRRKTSGESGFLSNPGSNEVTLPFPCCSSARGSQLKEKI